MWSLKLIFYIIIPLCLVVHGYYWIAENHSSVAAVYLMKLAGLLYLAESFYKVRQRITISWFPSAPIVLLIVTSSLLMPFFYQPTINYKYYLGDFAGMIVFFLCVYFTDMNLRLGFLSVEKIVEVISNSTVLISAWIIVYFVFSSGAKVSIPQEIHLGIALALSAFIMLRDTFNWQNATKIVVILLACILSLHRINLLAVLLTLASCAFWIVVFKKGSLARLILVTALFLLGGMLFDSLMKDVFQGVVPKLDASLFTSETEAESKIAPDRNSGAAILSANSPRLPSASVSIETNEVSESKIAIPVKIDNKSVHQRVLEAELILTEVMRRDSLMVWLLGFGFGAMYSNTDKHISHYPEKMHNAHSTPFVILLRNGLVGLLFFSLIAFAAIRRVLVAKEYAAMLFAGLVTILVSLMFDQYLYWGALLGLIVSLCRYFPTYAADRQAACHRESAPSSSLLNDASPLMEFRGKRALDKLNPA